MSRPSGRDLKGRSLRGADLHGADLHDADLRGADLSGADLRGADLRGACLGLTPSASALHTAAAAAVAALGGFTASWTGERIRAALLSDDGARQIGGLLLSAELLICLVAMVWRGPWFALRRVLPPTTALLLLTSLGAIVVRRSFAGLVVVGFVLLIAVVCTAELLARGLSRAVSKLAVVVVLGAWLVGARLASGQLTAVLVAVATGIAGMHADDRRTPWLTRQVRRFATVGGTCLRTADLRDARLTDARLHSSDLRGARLEGADWRSAREIRFCRFDDESGTGPPSSTG